MARIRAIVVLELLVLILAAPSVQAVPVQAPDDSSRDVVFILESEAAAVAPPRPPGDGAPSWSGGPEADRAFWNFLLRGPGGGHDVDDARGGNVAYSAPEPGTLLLVGAALAGAGVSIRRRRGRTPSGHGS